MAITKLENLNTLLANLIERYKKLVSVFDFPKMKREIDQLRQKMSAPDFWQDASLAAQISQRAENLNKDWERWQKLEQELKYLQELAGLLKNEFDADLSQEFVE
jgi:peptide chain release factor 2